MNVTGTVEYLIINRPIGKVAIREEKSPGMVETYSFILYDDTGVDMIDPTEMVRRNWIVGLLRQALADGLEVTVVTASDESSFVEAVDLYSEAQESWLTPLPLGESSVTTRGTVRSIDILPISGKVTLRVPVVLLDMKVFVENIFILYWDTQPRVIHKGLAEKRRRIIDLLQHALVHELEVSITHRDESNAFVRSIALHAREEVTPDPPTTIIENP